MEGFETPFGMELLATVHWTVTREAAHDQLVDRVYAWGDRKRAFTPRQIELAHATLAKQGWLPAA